MSRKCNRMEILVAKRNREGEGYYNYNNNNPTFAYGQGWDLALAALGIVR